MVKIVKYGAEWCGPCRTLSNLLKESNVNYEEVDIMEYPEALDNKGVAEIPYVEIVGDSDEILETYRNGLTKEDINELIKKYDGRIIKTVY